MCDYCGGVGGDGRFLMQILKNRRMKERCREEESELVGDRTTTLNKVSPSKILKGLNSSLWSDYYC